MQRHRVSSLGLRGAAALFLCAACGGRVAPADIAGTYAVTVTNGDDTCGFALWTPGESSTTTIRISENSLGEGSFDLGSGGGAFVGFFALDLGPTSYAIPSTVQGSTLTGTTQGESGNASGSCDYKINATVRVTVHGTDLEGTLTYVPVTNGDPSCGALSICSQQQTLSGQRQ
ncbi:MAG TPA: hypothetical protein VLM85_09815 [Polyangiaceae bacterium]|nr:hypothetical protein [Polyangiaceae bacterium]